MGKVLLGNDNRCNRSNEVKKDTMADTSWLKGTSCCSNIDEKFISSGSSSGSKYWDFNCPYGLPVWPPRNYTCSFCRREFKSAQALGGHMNVHRRDRARLRSSELKPSSPPPPPSSSALFSWKLVNDNATSPNISSSSHFQVNSNKRNPSNPTPDQTNYNLTSGGSMSIYSHQYSLVSLSLSCFSSYCPSTTLSSSTGSHNSHDGHHQPSSYDCSKGFSGAEEFNFRPIYSLDDGIQEKEGDHEEKAIAGIDLKLGFIEGSTDELDLELRL